MKTSISLAVLALLSGTAAFAADSTKVTPAHDTARHAQHKAQRQELKKDHEAVKADKAKLDSTRTKVKTELKADREAVKEAKAKGDTAAVKAAKEELKKDRKAGRDSLKADRQELKKDRTQLKQHKAD